MPGWFVDFKKKSQIKLTANESVGDGESLSVISTRLGAVDEWRRLHKDPFLSASGNTEPKRQNRKKSQFRRSLGAADQKEQEAKGHEGPSPPV